MTACHIKAFEDRRKVIPCPLECISVKLKSVTIIFAMELISSIYKQVALHVDKEGHNQTRIVFTLAALFNEMTWYIPLYWPF